MQSKQRVVIIDRKNANINSLRNAIKHVSDYHLSVSSDIKEIQKADFLILAGVGAFGDGMHDLLEKNLVDGLLEQALIKKKPFLGICLGMQMLFSESDEKGLNPGLNLIEGKIKYLDLKPKFRIPHVGWNNIEYDEDIKIFKGLGPDKNFYFVHSLHAECSKDYIVATADYDKKITAAVQKQNILGFQFHPEKSQGNGMVLLRNFLSGRYYDA
jgi:glutamine amidotransferase